MLIRLLTGSSLEISGHTPVERRQVERIIDDPEDDIHVRGVLIVRVREHRDPKSVVR